MYAAACVCVRVCVFACVCLSIFLSRYSYNYVHLVKGATVYVESSYLLRNIKSEIVRVYSWSARREGGRGARGARGSRGGWADTALISRSTFQMSKITSLLFVT